MQSFICPDCNKVINDSEDGNASYCDHYVSGKYPNAIPRIIAEIPNITNKSIIIEIGGFTGKFAKSMVRIHNPKMIIFEPITIFYEKLTEWIKQTNNNRILIYKYAIGGKERLERFYIDGQNTGMYQEWAQGKNQEIVTVAKLSEFLKISAIHKVDLLALNCEGGEYEILPEIIHSGAIYSINQILIQFHNCITNADAIALDILNKLGNTHNVVWNKGLFTWVLLQKK